MIITQDFDEYKLYVDTFCKGAYANVTVVSGKNRYYGTVRCASFGDVKFLAENALNEIDCYDDELHVAFGLDGDNLVHATIPSEQITALRDIRTSMSSYLPEILVNALWKELTDNYHATSHRKAI